MMINLTRTSNHYVESLKAETESRKRCTFSRVINNASGRDSWLFP